MDNLQAELNNIFALRKQLERDVLMYRNLQKSLVEQISEIRRREGTHSLLCISHWFVYLEASVELKRALDLHEEMEQPKEFLWRSFVW